jgi:hypothetical protein
MARAIAETPVMCGTYSMDGEDAEALAQAAYAVSGCDGLRKRVSELEEALRPFAMHAEAFGGGHEEADLDGHSLMKIDFSKARATLSRGE